MHRSLLAVISALLALSAHCGADAAEPRFTNLQVLPEDASTPQVIRVMKLMTRALGAQCATCHVTASRDYALDAQARKATARAMMRLEQARRSGLDWRRPPANLCVECHRGQLRPAGLPAARKG